MSATNGADGQFTGQLNAVRFNAPQFANAAEPTPSAPVTQTIEWTATDPTQSPGLQRGYGSMVVYAPSGGPADLLVKQSDGDGDPTDWTSLGGSPSTSFIVFNVRAFGAKGNGTTDDSASIRAAIAASSAAGGGIVYFPNGTYLVSESAPGSGYALLLPANTTLLGESKASAIIKLAPTLETFVRILVIRTSDCRVANLTFDGNQASQPNTDEHRAAIFLWNSTRCVLEDLILHDNTGDGIDIFVATFTVVQRCYSHDNLRTGIGIDGGVNQYIVIRDCYLELNAGGELVLEADATSQYIWVTTTYCGVPPGSVPTFSVSMGPNASDVYLTDMVIEGGFNVSGGATRVTIQNSTIEGSATGQCPVLISTDVSDVTVDGCVIHQASPAASDQPFAVFVEGSFSASALRPTRISIINSDIIVDPTTSDGVRVENALDVDISGNRIVSTSTTATNIAIVFFGTDPGFTPTMGNMFANDNHIDGWLTGIDAGLNIDGLTFQALQTNDNFIANCTNAYCYSDENHGGPAQVSMVGNDTVNVTNVWRNATDPDPRVTYPPCPILVGGLRGGGGIYQCGGSPNTQIAETVGAMALQRDGTGGVVGWIKTSGTGNTGWQSINVT